MTILAVLIALSAPFAAVDGATFESLMERVAEAEQAYDLELAKEVYTEYQEYVDSLPEEEVNQEILMGLARAALTVAELRRVDYEEQDLDAIKRRALGREIDEAAEVGREALDDIGETSEKYRLKSELMATMIRSKYRGSQMGDEMFDAAAKAVELDPSNAKAFVVAARKPLYSPESRGGDVEQALKLLNHAIELNPDLERAYVFRGVAYQELGQTEKAVADWQKALEINPNSRLAKLQLKRVQDGGEDPLKIETED